MSDHVSMMAPSKFPELLRFYLFLIYRALVLKHVNITAFLSYTLKCAYDSSTPNKT